MPLVTHLQCPLCGIGIKTTKALARGASVRCPNCSDEFHILASGETLVETIPVMGAKLPPRIDPYADVDPRRDPYAGIDSVVPTAPKPVPAVAPKEYRSKKQPFEFSRGLMAVLVGGPILGGVVIFVVWYASTLDSLTNRVDDATEKRNNRVKALAKEADSRKATIFSMMPVDQWPDRVSAPATHQIEDLVVGISSAQIGAVKMIRSGLTRLEHLTLKLRITNVGQKAFEYRSLALAKKLVLLQDQHRNYYNQVAYSPDDHPVDATPVAIIEPGKTITDAIVFEAPTGVNLDFYIDLSHPAASDRIYKFRIPSLMVQRLPSEIPTTFATQQVVTVPPTPAPYDPASDPQVTSSILSEFRAEWRAIERQAKAMNYDKSRNHKRMSHPKIITRLAEKYKLTEDIVQRIVPRL